MTEKNLTSKTVKKIMCEAKDFCNEKGSREFCYNSDHIICSYYGGIRLKLILEGALRMYN